MENSDASTHFPPGSKFDPAAVYEFIGKVGHNGFLGIDYHAHEKDWVELSMNWRDDLVGDVQTGVIASSVVISLLDNAISMSVWNLRGAFAAQVTMDLRVDYLRPSPKGAKVYGRGICYHLSRSIGFVRGIAHNGDLGDPLAHATGTFIQLGDIPR